MLGRPLPASRRCEAPRVGRGRRARAPPPLLLLTVARSGAAGAGRRRTATGPPTWSSAIRSYPDRSCRLRRLQSAGRAWLLFGGSRLAARISLPRLGRRGFAIRPRRRPEAAERRRGRRAPRATSMAIGTTISSSGDERPLDQSPFVALRRSDGRPARALLTRRSQSPPRRDAERAPTRRRSAMSTATPVTTSRSTIRARAEPERRVRTPLARRRSRSPGRARLGIQALVAPAAGVAHRRRALTTSTGTRCRTCSSARRSPARSRTRNEPSWSSAGDRCGASSSPRSAGAGSRSADAATAPLGTVDRACPRRPRTRGSTSCWRVSTRPSATPSRTARGRC